jgi:hypothetical protein
MHTKSDHRCTHNGNRIRSKKSQLALTNEYINKQTTCKRVGGEKSSVAVCCLSARRCLQLI